MFSCLLEADFGSCLVSRRYHGRRRRECWPLGLAPCSGGRRTSTAGPTVTRQTTPTDSHRTPSKTTSASSHGCSVSLSRYLISNIIMDREYKTLGTFLLMFHVYFLTEICPNIGDNVTTTAGFNLVKWSNCIIMERIYGITPLHIFGIIVCGLSRDTLYLLTGSLVSCDQRCYYSPWSLDWSIMGNDIHCCVMDLISSYDQPWDLL